jgi:hypothetical protein
VQDGEYGWIGRKSGSGCSDMPDLHWEFLRLWTGFELSSSWINLPCYGSNRNRSGLDFMRWSYFDHGAQDLNGIQRPKYFAKIAGSEVIDEYYNTYLRKEVQFPR